MQPRPDCFACFLKQRLISARLAGAPEKTQTALQRAVLRFLLRTDWTQNPPAIATELLPLTNRILRCADPYRNIKRTYNRLVLNLHPSLKARMAKAADPFGLAVRLALAGNIIDFGILEEVNLDAALRRTLRTKLSATTLKRFKRAIADAQHILYLADNAGEIGLDVFLIEQIKTINPAVRIHLALKPRPVINDATREDARFFGLEKLTTFTDTGTAMVGTHPKRSSAAFKKLYAAADLIIAKGQANWEALEDRSDHRTVFLLKAKCPVVMRLLKVPANEPVFRFASSRP